MSYRFRGLGDVGRLPVDIWGYVTAPDNPCFTGAMRNGRCMTPAELGFDPAAAAASWYGQQPIISTSTPGTGQRVMDVWRGVGPWQRYTDGTADVWTGDAWVSPTSPAGAAVVAASAAAGAAPAPAPAQVVNSNGASGATGGAALPGGGAKLSLPASASAVLDEAKGLPSWVWLAAAAGLGAMALMSGGGRHGRQ